MSNEMNMYLEVDRFRDGLIYIHESQIVSIENWFLEKINCLKVCTNDREYYTDEANVKWINREGMLGALKERGYIPGCKEK